MSLSLRPDPGPSAPPGPLRPVAGLAAPGDAELLALLLALDGARGRRLARAAIDAAGGLAALAAADLEELAALPSIDRALAARIAAAFDLGRRAAAAAAAAGWRVRTPADVGERLGPAMAHLEREELRVLLLNTKNVVTAASTVYVGNLAGSSVRVGEVFRDPVRRLAAAVVVVHNHPSGDPTPSADDLRITRELAEAGRLLDIELLDHVVVGGGRWVSLRSVGAL